MIMEGKIIDAGKLLGAIRDDPSINGANFARVKRHLAEAKAVDAVEVVHGRWLIHKGHFHDYAECSLCGEDYGKDTAMAFNYCPNCGAKMDGDGNG